MEFKKKYNELKTKINDNIPEIILAASTLTGIAAIGVAFYYKQLLEAEERDHDYCHGFYKWASTLVKENGDLTFSYDAETRKYRLTHIEPGIED